MLGDTTSVITAVGLLITALTGMLSTLYGMRIHKEVKNPNGSTTGLAVEEIHAAVATPPGSPTLGIVATDTNTTVKDDKTADRTGGGAQPPQGG